jgi:hypothetical protein
MGRYDRTTQEMRRGETPQGHTRASPFASCKSLIEPVIDALVAQQVSAHLAVALAAFPVLEYPVAFRTGQRHSQAMRWRSALGSRP